MPKGPHYHPYSNNSKSSTSSKVDTQPKSLGSSSLDALNSCVNSLNPAKVSPSLPTAKPKADTTVKTVSKFKFNQRLPYIFFSRSRRTQRHHLQAKILHQPKTLSHPLHQQEKMTNPTVCLIKYYSYHMSHIIWLPSIYIIINSFGNFLMHEIDDYMHPTVPIHHKFINTQSLVLIKEQLHMNFLHKTFKP